MYSRCFSIQSCSQRRPGICTETRPGIYLCSLSGQSLQGRGGQFLVLLNQSEQDQEPLSALALDCLCQIGLTPWSVRLPFCRTILLFRLLCKIMFLGHVGALADMLNCCRQMGSKDRKTVVYVIGSKFILSRIWWNLDIQNCEGLPENLGYFAASGLL